jgi:hypothetical protein
LSLAGNAAERWRAIGVEFGPSLGEWSALSQPTDQLIIPVISVGQSFSLHPALGVEPDLRPETSLQAVKPVGSYPYDHGVSSIKPDELPDRIRSASKPPLPEPVTDNDSRFAARARLSAAWECAAEDRNNPENCEVIAGDEVGFDDFRLAIYVQRRPVPGNRGDALKRFALPTDVQVIRIRGTSIWHGIDAGQLVWVPDGQGAEQEPIHYAKEGRISTNPQRQPKNRNGCKTRVPRQHPQAITNVLEEILNVVDPAHVAALLFDLLDAA